MSRKYYTPPPVLGDIPPFLKKAYLADYMRRLIQWSKLEYNMGMNYINKRASAKTIKYYQQNVSSMRVLAESGLFREVLEYLNENNFSQLSMRDRVFIRRTYDLFKALGG